MFVISQENRERITLKLTLKSATASGTKISFAANEEDCKSISSHRWCETQDLIGWNFNF